MNYGTLQEVKLFAGIGAEDMERMLGCIGHHVREFEKGAVIAFEEDRIQSVKELFRRELKL